MRTLPDYLGPGLDIVSIGINPSVYSVERGFNFARPGNRFWQALNASGLAPEPLAPSAAAVKRLFRMHRIGFTDLVKRATARADELTAADYARGARLLDIVSIGINPSVYSVERGFNFARPGNRFWPALNASGLAPEPLEPSVAAVKRLFRVHRIGFTDLVKRASARADELTAADYARGARLLERKLRRHRPAIAWFQGTSAYRIFLEHLGTPRAKIEPGLQPERIGTTRVFVTPNPSGANPAANLDKLVPLYRKLARLRASLAG